MNPGFSLADSKDLEVSQPMIPFPPLSDLSEHSFGISGQNVGRISWNFECYQFFILVGLGGNRATLGQGTNADAHVYFKLH